MPSGCTPLATSTGDGPLAALVRDSQMPTSGCAFSRAAKPRGDEAVRRLDDRRGVALGMGTATHE